MGETTITYMNMLRTKSNDEHKDAHKHAAMPEITGTLGRPFGLAHAHTIHIRDITLDANGTEITITSPQSSNLQEKPFDPKNLNGYKIFSFRKQRPKAKDQKIPGQ